LKYFHLWIFNDFFDFYIGDQWPPKYKNSPISAKFCFQVDYDVVNWYPSLVCYAGHLYPKWPPKYKNPPIWKKEREALRCKIGQLLNFVLVEDCGGI
jgi:hypothetical protein